MGELYEALTTETVNPASLHMDESDTLDMLRIINEQDCLVPLAVQKQLPEIGKAVDLLYERLSQGGHMVYVGAGTSGRLGVLDASECPPTFSTSPEMVQAYMAGGDIALLTAVEGSEDDEEAGKALVNEIGLSKKDVLIGITASGGAPFVLGAVRRAKAIGAATIGVVNNADSTLSAICDITIAPVVGPEILMGSTRMKSGTAQKLVLNMLTTGTMVRLGKVYGNLMVDLNVSNRKLHDRALRIIKYTTGVEGAAAEQALQKADKNVKLAILMLKTGLAKGDAEERLANSQGSLRKAISLSGMEG